MSLTNKQRKDLLAQASQMRSKVQVGQAGLTDGSLHAIDNVLEADEICKVKFLPNTEMASREEIDELSGHLRAEVLGTIGKVLILYRKNEEKARKKAQLAHAAKKPAGRTFARHGSKQRAGK